MRWYYLPVIILGVVSTPALADDHVPLERQFFDYFSGSCATSMNTQLQQQGKDPTASPYRDGIQTYCSCTAEAVVSWLSAEEILQFANNPEQEPGASKIRPYFLACRDKARQVTQ
jgi:hypothetical protein